MSPKRGNDLLSISQIIIERTKATSLQIILNLIFFYRYASLSMTQNPNSYSTHMILKRSHSPKAINVIDIKNCYMYF